MKRVALAALTLLTLAGFSKEDVAAKLDGEWESTVLEGHVLQVVNSPKPFAAYFNQGIALGGDMQVERVIANAAIVRIGDHGLFVVYFLKDGNIRFAQDGDFVSVTMKRVRRTGANAKSQKPIAAHIRPGP